MAEQAYIVASDSDTIGEENPSSSFPEIAIGIDIGTATSSFAVWNGSEVEHLKDSKNQKIIQTYVSFKDDVPRCGVGGQLSNEHEMLSGSAIFNIKRLIGRVDTDPLVHASKSLPFLVQTLDIGVRPFIAALVNNTWRSTTAEAVLAIFLVELRAMAEVQLKRSVRDVVLTIPVAFSRFQLSRVERACAMAGLRVLRLMPEPTAVALLYAQQQSLRDNTASGTEKTCLIFNLGAGFCDVAVSATAGGISQIKALAGAPIGGEDILQNLIHHLYPSYDEKSMPLLRVATENAIRKLSSENSVEIGINVEDGTRITKVVHRMEFEDVNRTVFGMCESLIRQCLRDAKVEAEDLTDVVLVGGCSNIPRVRNLVKRLCGKEELYEGIDPVEAAVSGAAIEGAMASGISDPLGNLDLLIIQATPLNIGIKADGKSFVPVIPRNTAMPTRKERTFTTVHDNQTEALIMVYEGEQTRTEENHLLGYFKLTRIPPSPRGVPEIIVSMDIDAMNVLRVLVGVTMPGNQQRAGPLMEVKMPNMDDGHGWCAEALHRTYGSTLDLALQKKALP
ncbi:hypothetical protein Dimus_001627 [Dionaea muscipula]